MINCDWKFTGKADKAERVLDDFKFNGPGWYFTSEGTVLAIPVDRTICNWWDQECKLNEFFIFHVWQNIDPTNMLNAIVNAPTRQDDRPEFGYDLMTV